MRKLIALVAVLGSAAACLGAAPVKNRTAEPSAPAEALRLLQPNGLAVDAAGSVFITDLAAHRLLKLGRGGVLSAVAGTGEGGFNGDGRPAAAARLFAPHDVAVDADGSLLVADTWNHRVRRIDRKGTITTVAGSGRDGYAGDGGPAVQASLNNPQGIARGPDGSLFIADTYNHVVRRIDPKGIISTFAGTEAGLAGDGGPANRAQISLPTGVAVAPDGTVYISEAGNNRVRRVRPDGVIETVAGYGPGSGTAGAGFGGDGGPAARARLFAPADVELNSSGDLYLSDSGNHRVRRISEGVIVTVAGSGTQGAAGDGGNALGAALNTPQKIALDGDGNLFVADRANGRVRKIDAAGRIESLGAGKEESISRDPS